MQVNRSPEGDGSRLRNDCCGETWSVHCAQIVERLPRVRHATSEKQQRSARQNAQYQTYVVMVAASKPSSTIDPLVLMAAVFAYRVAHY